MHCQAIVLLPLKSVTLVLKLCTSCQIEFLIFCGYTYFAVQHTHQQLRFFSFALFSVFFFGAI